MIIAIGTLRHPKVEAVKNTVDILGADILNYEGEIEYITRSSDSGISTMPMTDLELMKGACNRVLNLIGSLGTEKIKANYYIGLEGGFNRKTFEEEDVVFLQSWVYVSNGVKGYFGSSGNIYIPRKISDRVIKEGKELGQVIDDFAEEEDVRSKKGTFGVLTKEYLTRQKSFEFALLSAFAPFYNSEMYE